MNTYKGWQVFDEIPNGWQICQKVGSPHGDFVFITNGKSPLNGQKRALLKLNIQKSPIQYELNLDIHTPVIDKKQNHKIELPVDYALTMNRLSRERLKENLLRDLMVDIQICLIEGWDVKEYHLELKNLIDSLNINHNEVKNENG